MVLMLNLVSDDLLYLDDVLVEVVDVEGIDVVLENNEAMFGGVI